jgi:hypothetical protein
MTIYIYYKEMAKIYKSGKIYAIKTENSDDIYIGSTIKTLNTRLKEHALRYSKYLNGEYHFITSFDILKQEDFYIQLLEEHKDITRKELEKHEGEHIKKLKCVNKIVVGRTMQEYYLDNKDKIIEQTKTYKLNHKDEIAEKHKAWYEANKQKALENSKKHYERNREEILERQKKRNNEDKDNISVKQKKYYEENKDKILQRQRQKYQENKMKNQKK